MTHRYKKWDFMELKKELIMEERNIRPVRERLERKREQSKGWKAGFTKVVNWGPYDGKKVLAKLSMTA